MEKTRAAVTPSRVEILVPPALPATVEAASNSGFRDLHINELSRSELEDRLFRKLSKHEASEGMQFPDWFKNMLLYFSPFLQTNNPSRNLALANELAEAFREQVKTLVPALEKPFYYGMWGLSAFYSFVRNVLSGIYEGPISCLKTGLHDCFAEMLIPPLIVRYSNIGQGFIADKLKNIPVLAPLSKLIYWLKPFASMKLAQQAMSWIDERMLTLIPQFIEQIPIETREIISTFISDIGRTVARVFFRSRTQQLDG